MIGCLLGCGDGIVFTLAEALIEKSIQVYMLFQGSPEPFFMKQMPHSNTDEIFLDGFQGYLMAATGSKIRPSSQENEIF